MASFSNMFRPPPSPGAASSSWPKGSSGDIIRQGYCSTKEDGLISFRWNRRWVVLRENSITFHKSENAPQNSRILLADITNIDRTDLKPYCLLIEMNDRNKLYLCFSNDSQVYGWKDDIYVRTPLIGVGIPSGVSHNSTVGPDPKTGELTVS